MTMTMIEVDYGETIGAIADLRKMLGIYGHDIQALGGEHNRFSWRIKDDAKAQVAIAMLTLKGIPHKVLS